MTETLFLPYVLGNHRFNGIGYLKTLEPLRNAVSPIRTKIPSAGGKSLR